MTGLLLATPWEGNRNEAFAEYVLSSVAAVMRVRREADFGLDLLCTLMHYDDGVLHAGRSFGVQVKPVSEPTVTYGRIDGKTGKWKKYEINWLFSQDQPLFLGIVDLQAFSLKIYSTHRMWWIYNEIDNPGQIVLVPEAKPAGQLGIDSRSDRFKKTELSMLNDGTKAGDGFSYEIPLGEPVASIQLKQLGSEDRQFRSNTGKDYQRCS